MSRRVIGVLLIAGGVLMGFHKGEFWPYSIYPMFSKAGQPWTRAAVFDITDVEGGAGGGALEWSADVGGLKRAAGVNGLKGYYGGVAEQRIPLSRIRDRAVPVSRFGVDQIDFSNFVSKTREWTPERMQALHVMFMGGPEQDRRWLVAKVRGRLNGDREADVWVEPLFVMHHQGVVALGEAEGHTAEVVAADGSGLVSNCACQGVEINP